MQNNHKGFTLLELLTTLALASVLLFIAIPSWKDFRDHIQAKIIAQQLENSIAYARLEAVINYQFIMIQPINNNYTNGWDILDNTKIIKQYPSSPIPITATNLSKNNIIKIRPDGMTDGSNGNFTVGNYYKITINRGGRTYQEKIKK